MNEVFLNVSHLAPPEPMTEILKSLSSLASDQYLKVNHRRQPFPLFPILAENNWGYRVLVNSDDQVTIFIFHQQNADKFDKLGLIKLAKGGW